MNTYDHGVDHGFTVYCTERQRIRSFDQPRIVGYLSACTTGGAFDAGTLHGIALGASLQYQQQTATLELREQARP